MLLTCGCVRPDAISCGDRICPPEFRCDRATNTCIPPGCGDGVVDGTEECEPAVQVDADCRDFGYHSEGEALVCTPQCTLDLAGCADVGSCGDTKTNGPELCDGAPPTNLSCTSFGFGVGRLGCSTTCSPTFATCATIGGRVVGVAPVPLRAIAGSSDEAFAVGEAGTILRSSGDGWSADHPSNTTAELRAVWVAKGMRIAYAAGGDGVVLRFDGLAWSALPPAPVAEISAVWAGPTGEPVIVAGGDTSGVVAIYAGGAWTPRAFPNTGPIQGVAGDATGNLVVVARNGFIARRTLATDWITVSAGAACPAAAQAGDATCDLLAVSVIDGTFHAVGSNSNALGVTSPFLTSTNGLDWEGHETRTQLPLLAVDGSELADVYLGGREGILLRFDGTTIHRVESGFDTITGIWAPRPSALLATQSDGSIQLFAGEAWNDAAQIATLPASINLLGAASAQLGDGRTETIVVGEQARFMRTFDGVAWEAIAAPGAVAEPITGVTLDASGFAIASAGSVVGFERATVDAAMTPIGSTGQGNAVWATGAEAIIVGNGRVWQRSSSGTWTQRGVGTETLNGVWGSSMTDVWAVGNAGTLVHFDGTAWTAVASGVTADLRGVWGASATDVFAVGFGGVILHYDGTRWRRQHEGTELLFGVRGTTGTDVFAYGEGATFHYDGVAWSRVALPRAFGVRAMAVRGEGKRDAVVFAGGDRTTAALDRLLGTVKEETCDDGWDDDRDGVVDCADADCNNANACKSGGSCALVAGATCASTIAGTTFTGVARVDAWPALDVLTEGPEASYRFVAPASQRVTLSLATERALELVVLATHPDSKACDVRSTIGVGAGSPRSVTFDAVAGTAYVIVVDSPRVSTDERVRIDPDDFTMTIDCE